MQFGKVVMLNLESGILNLESSVKVNRLMLFQLDGTAFLHAERDKPEVRDHPVMHWKRRMEDFPNTATAAFPIESCLRDGLFTAPSEGQYMLLSRCDATYPSWHDSLMPNFEAVAEVDCFRQSCPVRFPKDTMPDPLMPNTIVNLES